MANANFTIPTTEAQRMLMALAFRIKVARKGNFTDRQREVLEKLFEQTLEEFAK